MKKLKLKALELSAKEILTREQLKNVMGGSGSGGGCLEEYDYDCSSQNPCCAGLKCEQNATKTGTICMKS